MLSAKLRHRIGTLWVCPGALDDVHGPFMHHMMRRKCPKKVSAATFTHDGEHALFADKFGDVYVAATAFPEQVLCPASLSPIANFAPPKGKSGCGWYAPHAVDTGCGYGIQDSHFDGFRHGCHPIL